MTISLCFIIILISPIVISDRHQFVAASTKMFETTLLNNQFTFCHILLQSRKKSVDFEREHSYTPWKRSIHT